MTSALKICPVCSTEYPANERFCPRDGSALRAQGGSSTDLVGMVIAERYHILKKLGEGGMGQVYLAEHVKMGRKSAVKVMNPGMVDNVDAVSRFNREASNASRINHPNVAGIYDFGETPEGLIYLAMEFVEGEPLTDIIREHGALPPMRASEIARQTAEGLAVAHDMGIVHRDLKPDNIMVAKGRAGADLVKVVDFGIAKAAASDNQKVTKTGMVVGTPEYMSPEQLSGDPLDARSDIYSLGLVTFAMLTGKLPFPSESMQETMIMRLTDKPKTLTDMRPEMHWPADVQAVMDKVLERDVNLRYAHASQFAHDLVQAIDRMPATTIHSMPTSVAPAMKVDAAIAATAATTRISAIPKTRVAGKAEVAGVTHAELAAAEREGAKKSKVPMLVVIGAVVVVGLGAMVMKIADNSGAKPTDSAAHSPATQPGSTPDSSAASLAGASDPSKGEPNKPQRSTPTATADAMLYTIGKNMGEFDDSDTTGYRNALREVNRVKLLTPADSGYAEIMRGQALLKLGEKVKACAKLQGASTNAALGATKQTLAKTTFDAYCSPSE